jgi:RNA polymerase-binding transcription factor DksA
MNPDHFKARLKEELKTIESELATIARPNPTQPGDWEATAGDFETMPEEAEEQAQKFQEEENNEGIVNALEQRLREINAALERIEAGTYGMCEIGNEPIEEDRLKANPAARTCKQHLEEEKNLPL